MEIDKEKLLFEYIEKNVEKVLKEPRDFIRYPFIDPGSVYDGNVWDWDTYWSVYGLLPLADRFQNQALKEKIVTHAKGNIFNFLDHQLEDGYIPMMIEVAQWKEPYLNMRHKEGKLMNMHKPFLCQQICLISDFIKDYSWVTKEMVSQLNRYFTCYEKYYYMENCGLFVWCDDIMIGMDNDPASFGRPRFSTANIFLNSFMTMELSCMVKILQEKERETEKTEKQETKEQETEQEYRESVLYYTGKRQNLIQAIQQECWDERDKFFYSVDVDIKTRDYDWFHKGLGVFWNSLPIRIKTWSCFLPLLAGIATKEQAENISEAWRDEESLGSPYGIMTLDKRERMFDLSATNNPSNWLGPIWLVANYAVFRGLLNYGYKEEARMMYEKTIELLGRDLEQTGSLHEYYNPFTGEPIMNGGFINWNILALNMFDELKE